MVRRLTNLLFAAVLAHAPYQCSRSNDARAKREETPAEALYALAGRLHEMGDDRACRATLAFLVERYPSSRFAESARLDLAEDAGAGSEVCPDGPQAAPPGAPSDAK